jgi:hypothetical protein
VPLELCSNTTTILVDHHTNLSLLHADSPLNQIHSCLVSLYLYPCLNNQSRPSINMPGKAKARTINCFFHGNQDQCMDDPVFRWPKASCIQIRKFRSYGSTCLLLKNHFSVSCSMVCGSTRNLIQSQPSRHVVPGILYQNKCLIHKGDAC